jgi:hypothetical protein
MPQPMNFISLSFHHERRHLWRNAGGNPVLVDRDTSHNSKPLLISATAQKDRHRTAEKRAECPFGAQTGMSVFRNIPLVGT